MITQLKIGYLRSELSALYDLPTDHPSIGLSLKLPMLAYHLALQERSILVDAPAYDIPDDAAHMIVSGFVPPTLLDQLESAGIDSEKVSDVIITHAHFDHFNGLTQILDGEISPIFPNAKHYLGIGDWQPETFGDLEKNTLQVVNGHGLLSLVERERDIGDGLSIIPAPGESPGHQMLRVVQNELQAFFVGDLYHHPIEFSEENLNVYWADVEDMKKSKKNLIHRVANSKAMVYFAHIEGPVQLEIMDGQLEWRHATTK